MIDSRFGAGGTYIMVTVLGAASKGGMTAPHIDGGEATAMAVEML